MSFEFPRPYTVRKRFYAFPFYIWVWGTECKILYVVRNEGLEYRFAYKPWLYVVFVRQWMKSPREKPHENKSEWAAIIAVCLSLGLDITHSVAVWFYLLNVP